MFRRFRGASSVSLLVALSLVWSVAATAAAERTSVIVIFDGGVSKPAALAKQLGQAHGFTARHVFGTAVKGFVASVPARAVAALAASPQVVAVEAETVERIVAQTTPTGIDRIEVDKRVTVGSGVTVNLPIAIIDTGISAHSDLNLAGGYAAAGSTFSDSNGHGTHVAGTVAAKDNGDGVVGVAPGAPVWAVRVCGSNGFCMSGDIVEGIDWAAARKAEANDGSADGDPGINFAAANFSISSADSNNSCSNPANTTHRAICGLVSRGTVFAMAAGNDARSKTAYPVAFTVAAIADFNGKAGGAAASTCRSDVDDTLADFSNWGVDIAAPGACILSTWNNGGYNTISGTSMATPHVTGAVGLYLHATGQAPATNASGVTAIENAIVAGALAQPHACGYTNERGSSEKLLFVNSTQFGGNGACDTSSSPPPSNTAPTVTITSPANNSTFTEGNTINFSGSASDNESGDLTSSLSWTSSIDGIIGSGGSFSRNLGVGTHTITASVTDPGGLTGSASISVTVDTAGGGDPSSMSATLSGSTQSSGSNWTATAIITVRDGNGGLLSGANVTGAWSGGSGGTSCTTGSSGTCNLSKSQHKRVGSATFTVTNVTKDDYAYDDADPSITISKP